MADTVYTFIIVPRTKPLPFPEGSRVRYLGDILFRQLHDGKMVVLLKKGMEYPVLKVSEDWFLTNIPSSDANEVVDEMVHGWGSYADVINQAAISIRDLKDWEIVR